MNKILLKPLPVLLLFTFFLLAMGSSVVVSEASTLVQSSYTSEQHLSFEKDLSSKLLVTELDLENEECEEMDAVEGRASVEFVLIKRSANNSILSQAKITSNPKFNIPII